MKLLRTDHRWAGFTVAIGIALTGVSAAPSPAQSTYTVFPAGATAKPAALQPQESQGVVTLALKDSTIAYAVNAIREQSHVHLIYNGSNPLLAKRVTVRIVKASAMEALATVLKGTGLVANLAPDGETIVISVLRSGEAENGSARVGGTIVGRVVDSVSGRGLGGATVRVQGTALATIATDSGHFTLRNVPVGDQVVTVRLFGHRPVTRTVTVTENAETPVRIVMATVPNVLSGMVTTATGTQRKLEVGNDITTLNVDSLRQVAPITSVTDLLESRVPGLTVLRSSGAPGDPARLRLRGAGSINGNNDPIVIVDGIRVYGAQSDRRTANLAQPAVSPQSIIPEIRTGDNNNGPPMSYAAPSPLDQIDPSSIETIEVLKGPSASSLYGSDAANGVIVITTKRGRAGPTHWSMNVTQGLSYLPGNYPALTVRWGHGTTDDGGDGALFDPVFNPAGGTLGLCNVTVNVKCDVVDSVTHLQVLNLPQWSPFGHGSSSAGSVNVSGGASALTYALTGSVGAEGGYLKLPDVMAEAFQQFHGYAVPGWAKRPNRYTTWGGTGQLSAQVMPTMQVTLQSALFHSLQQRSSLERIAPGFVGIIDTAAGFLGARLSNAYERASAEQLTFTNALQASWAPWAWLPLTGTAGLNTETGHDASLLARNIALVNPLASDASDTLGHYGVGQKSATLKTLNVNTLIPGWRGRLRTALGFNMYAQNTSDVVGKKDTLALGVTTPSSLGIGTSVRETGSTTYGWFFEPRLTLSQRFFLTPGFRLDGGTANGGSASVSGLPTKLSFAALFPKVNFSWVALDRQDSEVTPLFGVLTLLRPRLALGSAGVQPTPGDKLRLLGSPPGSSTNDTLIIQTLGNTQLRPERSFEVEGGVDAEAWHGRASLQVTHARKIQHDAIINAPVALSVYGGGFIKLNIGEIRNTSTELVASVRPIETPLVSWTIGGTMSRNDNTVLRLDRSSTAFGQSGVGETNYGSGVITIGGTRIAVGYPLFGRWALPIQGYADANDNGIIEKSEIRLGDTAVYLGRQDPAYTAGLTTDLTLFHGRLGVHALVSRTGGYSQLNASGADGLSMANDPTATFGQQAGYVASVTGLTQIGLAQTVSSWRFQSLSVNYEVPTTIAQRFRAPRMSVAVQGRNLGLWTTYRGKDPNVNAFPNGNATADGGQLAQPREWSLMMTLGN